MNNELKEKLNLVTKVIKNAKTKYKQGFTTKERDGLLDILEIDKDKFYSLDACNTCMKIDNDIIHYHCDVQNMIVETLTDKPLFFD